MHAGKRQWAYGFAAGVIFNFANILLVAAISIAGMAVAFPVSLGLAVVIGVLLNYLIKPVGNPVFLFGGSALVLAAVVIAAMAYHALGILRHEQLAKAGLAKSTRRTASLKGVFLALVSGVFMGAFLPLLDKGREGELGLGPYAVSAMFAVGVFASTAVFNMFFMNLPVEGEPVDIVDYFKGRPRQHLLGVLGGALWCAGLVANVVAGSAASDPVFSVARISPALSYPLTQSAVLIAALWGVLAWRELRDSDSKVRILIALMFVLFAGGLALVSLSPLFAKQA